MGIYSLCCASVVIDSTNNKILLEEGGVTALATIADGTYFLLPSRSDWLGTAIATALNAAFAGGNTYDVIYAGDAGYPCFDASRPTAIFRVRRTAGATSFRVRWASTSTTFDGELIGFVAEKSAADALAEESTVSPKLLWLSSAPHVMAKKSSEWVGVASPRTAAGKTQTSRSGSRVPQLEMIFQAVDGRRTFIDEEGTASLANSSCESWLDLALDGRAVIVAEGDEYDAGVLDAFGVGVIFEGVLTEANAKFEPESARMGLSLWDFSLFFAERDE